MKKERNMRTESSNVMARNTLLVALVAILSGALATASSSKPKSSEQTPAAAAAAQKGFASPKAAADALVQAAADFNVASLTEILGPDGEDLVASKDTVRDKNNAETFATEAREKLTVTVDPKNANRATIAVGSDAWPLPVPIVKRAGQWYFDSKAGRQEILYRRIGANELDAIQVCRGFVEAQEDYAAERHDGSEVNQYAQKIISTPGKHDGLAWQNADGSWGGPIGENVAKALEEGYSSKAQPFHGYYFKVLKGQGKDAPLGQMDFVVNGAMIGGFALAAAPADYRVTGVQTFIVSYEGVVYQKDLGPDTLKTFQAMELYNPDKTWHSTDDNW